MTWFRGMERRGIRIHWVDHSMPDDEKVAQILSLYQQSQHDTFLS